MVQILLQNMCPCITTKVPINCRCSTQLLVIGSGAQLSHGWGHTKSMKMHQCIKQQSHCKAQLGHEDVLILHAQITNMRVAATSVAVDSGSNTHAQKHSITRCCVCIELKHPHYRCTPLLLCTHHAVAASQQRRGCILPFIYAACPRPRPRRPPRPRPRPPLPPDAAPVRPGRSPRPAAVAVATHAALAAAKAATAASGDSGCSVVHCSGRSARCCCAWLRIRSRLRLPASRKRARRNSAARSTNNRVVCRIWTAPALNSFSHAFSCSAKLGLPSSGSTRRGAAPAGALPSSAAAAGEAAGVLLYSPECK